MNEHSSNKLIRCTSPVKRWPIQRRQKGFYYLVFIASLFLWSDHNSCLYYRVEAFSNSQQNTNDKSTSALSRRDLLWKIPIGAAFTYGYGKLTYQTLTTITGDEVLKYPAVHEDRVKSVIKSAIQASIGSNTNTNSAASNQQHLRILEVGSGKDLSVIRRHLYDEAFQKALEMTSSIELTGIDLFQPTPRALEDAHNILQQQEFDNKVSLNFHQGSITSPHSLAILNSESERPYDVILCRFTLCSVDDPLVAIKNIYQLLKPNGGTLAYVEHVAVDTSIEPYKFLSWQQQVLDPLQQLLADNCHLHRPTQSLINQVFKSTPSQDDTSGDNSKRSSGRILQQERFLIDSMWPVSCQCSGIVQRII